MAKVSKVRRKSVSRRYRGAPYSKPSSNKIKHRVCEKNCYHASDKIDWKESTCSVCMESPHNAVLLLCSSYNKGCRPYMCATSYRYSNCLDQYKKAYTKVISREFDSGLSLPNEKKEEAELLCPLCRGQVKGWTVVEPARQYLNAKKRTCMQENCSFVGTFKQLRKHVNAEHPSARPREVDPTVEANWNRLQHERERSDVISTIRSSTPNAIVSGDYVIEGNYRELHRNSDDLDNYVVGDTFSPPGGRFGRGHIRFLEEEDDDDDVSDDMFQMPAIDAVRYLYGRTRRRHTHRGASGERENLGPFTLTQL